MASPDADVRLSFCTQLLAPHVRTVIESLVHLMHPDARWHSAPDPRRCHVVFFDRFRQLQQYLDSCSIPHPRTIYIRGFEPYTHAFCADHVLDRPIRPSALAAVFASLQAQARRPAGTRAGLPVFTAPQTLAVDEALSQLIPIAESKQRTALQRMDGLAWLLDFEDRTVLGPPLEPLSAPARPQWSLEPAESWRADGGQPTALEGWLHAFATGAEGRPLPTVDDELRLLVDRVATTSAIGRDVIRLKILFLRGSSMREASATTGLPITTVRKFVSVKKILCQIRPAVTVAQPGPRSVAPAVQTELPLFPTQPTTEHPPVNGLFSRLWQRLFTRHGH